MTQKNVSQLTPRSQVQEVDRQNITILYWKKKKKISRFCSAQNSFQIRSARYFRKEPDELILTHCLRHTKSIV